MYKGVARLVGMDVIALRRHSRRTNSRPWPKNWDKYDFFFVHIKYTDSRGEDGDFEAKVKMIEGVDAALPQSAWP